MIVINPPWTLMAKMSQLLPRLVDTLGEDDGANYTCDVLVGE
jgi:23S rRNA A2030 N6-methylase RlmJ